MVGIPKQALKGVVTKPRYLVFSKGTRHTSFLKAIKSLFTSLQIQRGGGSGGGGPSVGHGP